ncbi:MAG: hypothetical protein RR061_06070 [Muribaculaceae bacterium]
MIDIIKKIHIWILFATVFFLTSCSSQDIYVYADKENDLCKLLNYEGFQVHHCDSKLDVVTKAPIGSGVLILAADYPEKGTELTQQIVDIIQKKKLRCYVEFVDRIGNKQLSDKPIELKLERAVVTKDKLLGDSLPIMSILGLNRNFIFPMKSKDPLMVTAKVVGLEKAELGLDNTPNNSLLFFYSDRLMISTSQLSNFATGRFTPEYKWKQVFEYIIGWVSGSQKNIHFNKWLTYVKPMYNEKEQLPLNARKESIQKGIEWFSNGHFLLSEESLPIFRKYETEWPYGPGLDPALKNGNGSLGVLEGHGSIIHSDGKQDYRYWLRNDVQGEVILAMHLAGIYLQDSTYSNVAENIMGFAFNTYTQGIRRDIKSSNYGLMSWTTLYPDTYYGDDNARALLGYILANTKMKNKEWDRKIVECIIANFRTSSKQGYRGSTGMSAQEIEKKGWKYYSTMDYINPHPHFESWIWACYLWLYDKTGYLPLLEKAKTGISTTMAAYPNKWRWTNGIQQERGRMILPLAWLVRIDPSENHKRWLNMLVDDLLKSQVICGAIQEQMGDPSLNFVGEIKKNEDYGKYEASLIYKNGDPVSDMLYTTNFAFFGLNEAVRLTGNPTHKEALNRISDFLIRIQVSSEKFKDVDGAWFRAFNYKNWDYWADNADNGWGAWCTLTGWIQSWIVGTQILIDTDTTYWDLTKKSVAGDCLDDVVKEML